MMNPSQMSSPPRLLLRVPEVAQTLGIGRTKVAELIAAGVLPTVRIGRCVRISATALEKWVAQQEQAGI